jgi:hypothetical protein
MRSLPKVLFWFIVSFGLTALLTGFGLEEHQPLGLARFLSQTGVPDPRNLDKLRLMSPTLKLAGIETFFLVGLVLYRWKALTQCTWEHSKDLTVRRTFFLLLLMGYLGITLLMMNFGTLILTRRIINTHHLSNQEIVAMDYGKDYILLQTLRDRTPEDACILIQTRNDIKYLLNYDLYPRRFFFFHDSGSLLAEIPEDWMDEHQISWILEVDDHDPTRFILMKRQRRL